MNYPNYKKSIPNLVSSILKYYDCNFKHSTVASLDSYLNKRYKNIILVVIDGMGAPYVEENLEKTSFFNRDRKDILDSTFPTTTAAAMNSYYSALTPMEHGWLGWSLYFKEVANHVDVFVNCDSFSKKQIEGERIANKLLSYESIFEKIDKKTNGKIKQYTLNPVKVKLDETGNKDIIYKNLEEFSKNIIELSKDEEEKFIFAYWNKLDDTLHNHGLKSSEALGELRELDDKLEEISKKLDEDSLLIISADHGLVDIEEYIYLDEYEDLVECLSIPPQIDPRALSFHVKKDMESVFKKRFDNLFKSDFLLLTREEVMEKKVFGIGKSHRKSLDFIGDFVAIGIGDKLMKYRTLNGKKLSRQKAHHSGLREEELKIPLIIYTKNEEGRL